MSKTPATVKELDARIAELRAEGKDVSALEQKRAEVAKAAGSDDVGIVDPENKGEAAAAQNGTDIANSFSNGAGAVKDAAVSGFGAIGDFFSDLFGGDDEGDSASGDGKGKKGKFKWGNGIGGILGVMGAYLLSNIFGGGMLGTIMFALFAIPAFMMGRSQLGGGISSLIGEEPSTPSPVKSHGVQVAQNQSVSGVSSGSLPQVTTPQVTTPQQALQAEVMEVAQKSQIARATIIQQAQTGEINPRSAQGLMEKVSETQMMVQQMQAVDINRLNEQEIRNINSRFGQAEMFLDRTIRSNPIVAAQVSQSMTPPPAPTGPVFAGSPQNTIGVNLTPEAQAQLQNVRQNGQNYNYQPAQQNVYETPRFTGVPDQQGYVLPDAYIPR